MAVRAFNGSSDLINTATGALATNTFGTQAVLVKRGTTGAWHTFLAFHNSGGDALTQFAYNNSDVTVMWKSVGPDTSTGPAAIATTAWGLIVYRKATGTATGRFSLYNFSTQAWTHGAANISMGDWTAPGASGTVRVEWQGGDRLNGRLAVRAAWNSLPWNANAGGDNAIESAGLETSLQAWIDASPDALWAFNQASTATAVEDLTGGGADQTSISGTTVITNDDPPGFTFESGAGVVTGTAQGSYGFAGTAAGVRATAGTAAGSYGFTATASGLRTVLGAAAGAYGFTGTAAGVVSGVITGTAQGSYGFAGTATGVRRVLGQATGSYGFVGTAIGTNGVLTAIIVGAVTGPSRHVETVTGPALRRVVTGPEVRRELTGPALATVGVDGPSRHVDDLDGPDLSRVVTGPDAARTLTGAEI